jgi:tRNA nucleotidyltransferase (CCA-adding enzyme)
MPRFGDEFLLIRTGRFKNAVERAVQSPKRARMEESGALLKRLGKALEKPGISQSKRDRRSTLYSVDPRDPTRIVRRNANGKTTIGRLVAGRFRADG